MAKNVVFTVAIEDHHKLDYVTFFQKTWQHWCERNGAVLVTLTRFPALAPSTMPASCLRYMMFELLDNRIGEYGRVAYVDADTMVRWDSPNFFGLIDKETVGLVRDLGDKFWIWRALTNYGGYFPNVTLDWFNYANGGFILLDSHNEKHRNAFAETYLFISEHLDELKELPVNAGPFDDQTVFNYVLRKNCVPIHFFPCEYNLLDIEKNNLLSQGNFVHRAFVWHFNFEEHDLRYHVMEQVWNALSPFYHRRSESNRDTSLHESSLAIRIPLYIRLRRLWRNFLWIAASEIQFISDKISAVIRLLLNRL